MAALPDFAAEREAMVELQLRRRGIADERVRAAFRTVPREAFVPDDQRRLAYGDHPLAIGFGQTISQPYIVALMIEAARIAPGDTVLEVGAGSGYAAALISRIAGKVIAFERHPELAVAAARRLAELGFDNVEIIAGDGSRGCPGQAPFDAILAAASGSHVPQPLIDQLAAGGRLVMPLGDPGSVQELVQVTKGADGRIEQSGLGAVRFVPLIGEEGWSERG